MCCDSCDPYDLSDIFGTVKTEGSCSGQAPIFRRLCESSQKAPGTSLPKLSRCGAGPLPPPLFSTFSARRHDSRAAAKGQRDTIHSAGAGPAHG